MTRSTREVFGGVDTHKDQHHGAVVDGTGKILDNAAFPASLAGYRALLKWMKSFGHLSRVGVEGTSSYGMNLVRHLNANNVHVVEVNRPNRQDRRRHGKSDPADAEAAARAALNGDAVGVPKRHDGPVESIRLLRIARRSAVSERTATINQIRTVINTCCNELGDELRKLSVSLLASRCARLRPNGQLADPAVAAKETLRVLGQRLIFMNDQIKALDTQLSSLVTQIPPALIEQVGVGIDTAGALLVAAGQNAERLQSEAAFAAICGVSPVDASSGKQTRHRLNRGGNREANAALWRIALVRMSCHQPTKDYVAKRTAQGKTKREILRSLKRYITRQLFPLLVHTTQTTSQAA